MRRLPTTLAVLAVLSGAAIADQPARDGAIVARAVEDYIRPAVARFAADTSRLDAAVAGFCAAPTATDRRSLDTAFRSAVEAWSGVQFLRFGPLMEANRLERVAFWPDPTGVGLRQIRRALADRDPTVVDPSALARKSVALQVLTALDYLLYAGEGEAAGTPGDAGAFRCAYAVAAARALAELASAVAGEWTDPRGFARRLLEPGADHPLYRTPSEAMSALHGALGTGLQVVQDLKLKPVLGADPDAARPLAAPFRRSGLTMAVLVADLRALRAFVEAAGFARALPPEQGWLGGSMAFGFDQALAAVEAVGRPIEEAVYDPAARDRLGYTVVVLGHLRDLTQRELAAALGLTVGFNALDGD